MGNGQYVTTADSVALDNYGSQVMVISTRVWTEPDGTTGRAYLTGRIMQAATFEELNNGVVTTPAMDITFTDDQMRKMYAMLDTYFGGANNGN